MTERDDHQLLAEFARENSETAFAALVGRHINLVYATALRSVGNAHTAEEITQAVFIILARKSNRLSAKIILSGWLYQTTRLTAANFLRGEIRRQQREQEAYMQSLFNDTDPAETWRRIAPLLDAALDKLGAKDRDALALRFFEDKSLAEVGRALGASEDAAKMRVNRALEKLRKFFAKRGVTLSTALIAGAVSTSSVQAAPAGLAATITATSAKGATISATLTTLVKGTMKTMTWLKMKFAVGVGVTALLVGGVATVAISQPSGGDKLTAQEITKRAQAAYAALSSYSDSGKVVQEVGGHTLMTTFNIRLQRPNLYRVEWSQATEYFTNGGTAWSAGTGDFLVIKHGQYHAQPAKYPNTKMALDAAKGISGQASSTIPETFFEQNGNVLNSINSTLQKQADENIAGIDCYVVSSSLEPAKLPNQGQLPNNAGKVGKTTMTLWIGKQDHLIHQTQTIMENVSINLPRLERQTQTSLDSISAKMSQMTDSDIKSLLETQNKPATPEAIAAMKTQLATAGKILASGISGKFVFTQTHENIVVNRKLSLADFTR